MKEYHKQTNYQTVEEFKRLDFIVGEVQKNAPANGKILDIGCGNGNLSMALGSLGYNVKGIDVDATSIATATAKNTFTNVVFEVADANKFTINDEYDLIVCTEVLEHLDTPTELVQSAYRILKPGGTMVVTVPNGFGPRETLMTKPMQWMMRKGHAKTLVNIKRFFGYKHATEQSSNPDLTHTQFFTRRSLFAMMEGAGFKPMAFGKGDFLEFVFPISLLTNRIKALQRLDTKVADYLPAGFTNCFYTSWKK